MTTKIEAELVTVSVKDREGLNELIADIEARPKVFRVVTLRDTAFGGWRHASHDWSNTAPWFLRMLKQYAQRNNRIAS